MRNELKKITILIPFLMSVGAEANNALELRQTLRSIEKNAKFDHQVVIVGDQLPEWLNENEVVFIQETLPRRADFSCAWNVIEKIKIALQSPQVSEHVLFCYDDTVFASPVSVADLFTVVALTDIKKQDIAAINASDVWKTILRFTFAALNRNKMTTYNFETHIPRLFDKSKLAALIEKFGFEKRPYMFSTLYFNEYHTAKQKPFMLLDNPNQRIKAGVYSDTDFEAVRATIQDYKFLNWGEQYFSKDLEEWLLTAFPEPSKYEIPIDTDETSSTD